VRRILMMAVAGLIPALALSGVRPTEAKDKPAAESTCGDHGTSVIFEATPRAAAKKARKDKKLVFILHVSGLFEDPKLT
jgi:hypothetical protein